MFLKEDHAINHHRVERPSFEPLIRRNQDSKVALP